MKVTPRNPRRVVDVDGVRSVGLLLHRLSINPETVSVIRGSDLLMREEPLRDAEEIEIRALKV